MKIHVTTEKIGKLKSICATAGIFCRLQVAGCRLQFHYNWKTAGTKKKGKAIDLP